MLKLNDIDRKNNIYIFKIINIYLKRIYIYNCATFQMLTLSIESVIFIVFFYEDNSTFND